MFGFDALTASYFEFRVPGRSKSSTSSSSPSSLLLSSLLLLTNLERKCVSANLPNFSGKKKQRHNLAGGFFSINRDYEAINIRCCHRYGYIMISEQAQTFIIKPL